MKLKPRSLFMNMCLILNDVHSQSSQERVLEQSGMETRQEQPSVAHPLHKCVCGVAILQRTHIKPQSGHFRPYVFKAVTKC